MFVQRLHVCISVRPCVLALSVFACLCNDFFDCSSEHQCAPLRAGSSCAGGECVDSFVLCVYNDIFHLGISVRPFVLVAPVLAAALAG